jgi:hypothetical protein
MRRNLASYSGRYSIIERYETPPPAKEYDLVIIDGPGASYGSEGRVAVTEKILGYLDSIATVYIEGSRYKQRFAAINVLGKQYCLSLTRHPSGFVEGRRYKGGLKIRCIRENRPWLKACVRLFSLLKEYIHSRIRWIRGRIRKIRKLLHR